MKKEKELKKLNERIVRLKRNYFKIKNILGKMWDDLYYLHEEINKLAGEKISK